MGWTAEVEALLLNKPDFPGDVVARERDLESEQTNAGKPVVKLGVAKCRRASTASMRSDADRSIAPVTH